MRILFIEPPSSAYLNILHGQWPNLAFTSIGAYVEQFGYDLRIIDMPALNLDWKDIPEIIKKERPTIVGISGIITAKAYMYMVLAKILKDIDPGIIIIVGGLHFTLTPEESLKICRQIDYIVIGEGELTFLELIKAIEKNRKKSDMVDIRGIAYLDDEGNYIQTPPRPLIEDLDVLPMPAYHLLPMDKYVFPMLGKNTITCVFSRGCLYRCIFCAESAVWKGTYRERSAKKVVDELELLMKKYKKEGFYIGDDSFLLNRQRNLDFLNEMEKRKLNGKFRIFSRVDHIIMNRDLLERFKKIGLTAIFVGVESFSQDTLDYMNKRQKVDDIKLMAKYVKKAGIPVLITNLIFGYDNDNRKTINDFIMQSKSIKPTSIGISLLTPWPGLPLFAQMKQAHRIKVWDYRKYDIDHAIMPTRYLSVIEIEKLAAKASFKWEMNLLRFLRELFQIDRRRIRVFYLRLIAKVIWKLVKTKIIKRKPDKSSLLINEFYYKHLDYIGIKKEEDSQATFRVWR